jgi:serine protease AprX
MFSRRLSLGLAVLTLLGFAAQPVSAQTQNNKVDRGLTDALTTGARTQRVIISVKPGYRDGVRAALKAHGDVIKSEHPLVEAIAAEIHSSDVAELAGHPSIEYVSLDATVYAGAAHVEPRRITRTSLKNALTTSSTTLSSLLPKSTTRETLGLQARPSPTSMTGARVTVAVIDSGIEPNEDLSGRIVGFYDFTKGGVPAKPYDDFGHGTHIAGLIGSSGLLSSGQYMGVAPQVNFVGMKVLDRNGSGNTSDVIKALEYLTADKLTRNVLGVQVVNMSLGHPILAPAAQDPLVQAVEHAVRAGLIVVCSAGNFGQNQDNQAGYTGITSPGNAPSAITIGAADTKNTVTRVDDSIAPFSSRGPTWFDGFAKPDVVAPGVNMISDALPLQTLFKALTQNHVSDAKGHQFLSLSGTSMAAAVASGVVALVVDAHNRAGFPNARPLTANLVKAILEYSAIPVANADTLTQGAGEINASGAIALASAIDTGASLDSWWVRSSVPGLTAIGGATYAWSRHIVWGSTVLTGNALFYDLKTWAQSSEWGDNIVWGTFAQVAADNIVWGTTAAWASHIVWSDRVIGQRSGDNIVWGTSDDGDNIVWGTLEGDNIVWGTVAGQNIIFSTTTDGDNVVWGTYDGDNIVWGTSVDGDNIVWGTADDGDNVVWGTSLTNSKLGGNF